MHYDLCLELVKGLEIVRRHHLKNSLVITAITNLVYQYQVNDLLLLNEVAESLLSVNTGKPDNSLPEITPQTLLDAEILEREISPLVSEIRKDVFGKEDIPFPNRESALDWLNQQAPSDQDIMNEYKKTNENSMGGEATLRLVIMEHKTFLVGTPPATIFDKTEEISHGTGVNHPSLVMHVLADTRIVCRKWDMTTFRVMQRLPSGIKTDVKGTTIRFTGTLSFEDMRQIYNTIKRDFKLQKSKEINAKHLELYRLINEREIPQRKGKVAFWKQITEEWNDRHPESKYSTWKGVSMAYSRIIKNTGRRFQGGTR